MLLWRWSSSLDEPHDIHEAYFGTIRAILEDIQHRLIFRTQAYIRDQIERYQPSQKDLDFPRRLSSEQVTSIEPSASPNIKRSEWDRDTWYPTLSRSLHLLSKLYDVLKVRRLLIMNCADRWYSMLMVDSNFWSIGRRYCHCNDSIFAESCSTDCW
jgi:hypothetical protein